MKKITAFLLCAFLICAAGCGGGGAGQPAADAPAATPEETVTPDETPTGTPNESETDDPAGSDETQETAVVCFSATGNTSAVAQIMAGLLGADFFEIVPAEPYTDDDLNYSDGDCRANREQNDPSARPEIAGDLRGIDGYETVYIGYPIWWGANPRIIETFLDAFDLSGATVYTFCTSGSSGVETSVDHLREQYPDVDIVSGHRFNAGASEADVDEWLKGLE